MHGPLGSKVQGGAAMIAKQLSQRTRKVREDAQEVRSRKLSSISHPCHKAPITAYVVLPGLKLGLRLYPVTTQAR